MRKLATIQRIAGLKPIQSADAIELAQIMGWQVVVKKGEYEVGDYCVYFEVDSYLPIDDRYEFLRKSSYRKNEYIGEGFRIKTMRLRGELSQGLVLPVSLYSEVLPATISEGDDLTELLGVKKWFLPEVEGGSGSVIGKKPYGIPTTDELRVQSSDILRQALLGKPYYITTKMDGTSMTVYCKDGKVGVCGRNDEYADTPDSGYWAMAHRLNLPEKLKYFGRNLAIQGELCGHGIQKNKLRLLEPKFYVFDIFDLDSRKYMGLHELNCLCEVLFLDTVPIEEYGDSFNYTLAELLLKSEGDYVSGVPKEGIVVRAQTPGYSVEAQSKLSFKVLNNKVLLADKD